jgi:purine-nucleoside phosphorylase
MNNAILNRAFKKARTVFGNARPFCSVILGSGWGNISGAFKTRRVLAYADIPGMGKPGVDGHAGRLVIAEFAGKQVFIFEGRRHWYEGAGWEPVAIPVYISVQFKVPVILLTNAAGGIRRGMEPGDLMVIDDHINAIGSHPLAGNNDPVWGPMFADQSCVYDKRLRALLDKSAAKTGTRVRHGVYLVASGPTYETPAEIRAFRAMGADAVGMSTVPEAMLANAAGMRVAAVSCITNAAAHKGGTSLSHREVVKNAARVRPALTALLTEFLKEVASDVRRRQTKT